MPQPRGLRAPTRAARVAGRSLQHPSDRTEAPRSRFDQFAERVSFLASSPLFFVVCALVVLAWAVGLALGASDRFEAATAGLMSAVTLMLVAVVKNSELRTDRALHTKLDAIASALLEDRRGHEGGAEEQLERSIGVHDEI
ncbi:MAG TPA: low affinity iron permease family protein [Solirubrobacteraceae bacterium]|nr:low affinity iron permease family protein [Solirubrobacteraceae bacterium]